MRALPAPSAVSRLQRPADIVGASASRSLQPLPKPTLSARDDDPIMTLINSVRTDDWDKSVIALKYIQHELDQAPEKFTSNVQTLCDALLDQLDRAFTPPENLRDPAVFRLVKHIIQSFSGFAANQDLMRRLSYDDVYALIHGLSLHLVQADRLGGLSSELVQFINMILIQTLATPDRYIVFRAMFELLLNLTKDFTENNVKPEDEVACHADLVIKCLWKRCKILDDDFMSGRLSPGALFGILEDFVRAVPPAEYRRREKLGIALGELPLRTVKTIIQKIIRETLHLSSGADPADLQCMRRIMAWRFTTS
jgi:cytoskeleton-associated protein 5